MGLVGHGTSIPRTDPPASDTSSTVAPWYGVHHGKDAVVAFFEAFGSEMEVQQFEPFSFAANDTEAAFQD